MRVWQDEINVGCDPPNFPTKKYIELHQEWYGEPVAPHSTDTCPESYPDSAHKHAAELIANAAKAHTPHTRTRPAAAVRAGGRAAEGHLEHRAPHVPQAAHSQASLAAAQPDAQPGAQPDAQPAVRWWQQATRVEIVQPASQPQPQPQPQPQLATRADGEAAAASSWPLFGMAGAVLVLALVATVLVLPQRLRHPLHRSLLAEDEGEYQLAE